MDNRTKAASAATRTEDNSETRHEPTLHDWQDLICFVAFEDEKLRNTVYLLLRSTESGRAYLERVTRYRPEIEKKAARIFAIWPTISTRSKRSTS